MKTKFLRGILLFGVLSLLIVSTYGLKVQAQDIPPLKQTLDILPERDLHSSGNPPGSLAVNQLINESFTGDTFPPTGWTVHRLQGSANQWDRSTDIYNSAPGSAFHRYSDFGYGFHDDWLVTPPFTLATNEGVLSFIDAGRWMMDYEYSGVWISMNSCNPNDNDFVELAEIDDTPGNSGTIIWRDAPLSITLSASAGETVCLAFRYSGENAHTWYIDDVVITDGIPVIDVSPAAIGAVLAVDTQINQTLVIGNTGSAGLTWEIAEAPKAARISLTLEDSDTENSISSSPIALVLDDGIGENSIGLTAGGQMTWFNRFTPNNDYYPITIDKVDVMFGYPGSAGGINVGELIDIYLYEDADANPANGATHRASLKNQAIQAVDGSWSSYTLTTPVTFDGPGDILIAVVNRTAGLAAGTYPATIDQTAVSHQRSWIGFGTGDIADPPVFPLATFAVIDTFGYPGNWMIRGFGTGNSNPCENPADIPWLNVSPKNGTIAAGATNNVTVSFNSTGLAPGEYRANLCLASNDIENPEVTIPVTMNVVDSFRQFLPIIARPF